LIRFDIKTFDNLKHFSETQIKPAKGEVLHDFLQGTSLKLTGEENIELVGFMEAQVIEIARAKGFRGVFTNNSNALTQQFGQSVFGFETLAEVCINKYVDKFGKKPFQKAPDNEKIYVMYKSLKGS
jgi:catalase (peroxidase I)